MPAVGPTRINAVRAARGQHGIEAGIVDVLQEAVIATDLDGHIIFWNAFAESLYGWDRSEVMGLKLSDLLAPGHSREGTADIVRRLQGGESWAGEMTLRYRDGHVFQAKVSGAPLKSPKGSTFGIVSFSAPAAAFTEALPDGGSPIARVGPKSGRDLSTRQLLIMALAMGVVATALFLTERAERFLTPALQARTVEATGSVGAPAS